MKPFKILALLMFVLLMALANRLPAVVINNPDGTKVWFNNCPPGEECVMTYADSALVSLLQQILAADSLRLITDSAGNFYIATAAETVTLNLSPDAVVTFNIDTADMNINFPDTMAVKITNDSSGFFYFTDSLTLNPGTYKSISYTSYADGNIIRIGNSNSTVPKGDIGGWSCSGALIERHRFVGTFSVKILK